MVGPHMGNATVAVPLRQSMILFLPGCLIAESVKGDDQGKYVPKGAGGVILLDHRARTVKHTVLGGENGVDCCLTALSWSVQPSTLVQGHLSSCQAFSEG